MGLWDALALDMDRRRVVTLVGGGGKTTSLYALAREARAAGRTVAVTTTTHMMPHPGLLLVEETDPDRIRALLSAHGILTVGRLDERGKLTGGDVAACAAAADVVLVEGDGARLLPLKAPAGHEPVIPPRTDAVLAVAGMDCLGGEIGAVCHRPAQVCALLGKPMTAAATVGDVARVLSSPAGGRKQVEAHMAFGCILNKADNPARLAGAEAVAALLAEGGIPTAITSYSEEERGGLCWF